MLNEAFCALSFVWVYLFKLRGSWWWHPVSFDAERLAPQRQDDHSRCLAHFYKHSVNDTQLAARRQLSLPSLRPNLSLPQSFPPLSHSGAQLGRLSSLPPSHPEGPDFVEPKLQKLTSWSWFSLPFLFVELPVLPGRDFLMHRQLGR